MVHHDLILHDAQTEENHALLRAFAPHAYFEMRTFLASDGRRRRGNRLHTPPQGKRGPVINTPVTPGDGRI